MFHVQNAIQEVVVKMRIHLQGRGIIFLVQGAVLLTEEEAVRHYMFLFREVVFLLEVSWLDQIFPLQVHFLEEIEALDSVLEDSVLEDSAGFVLVFLLVARFHRRSDLSQNKEVLMISQKCMTVVSVPFLFGATRVSLEGSREGEEFVVVAGSHEVEGV